MNFINVNTTQNGNRPTSNANYIGLVYSNVLNSSLSFYLPLTGGILSSNLGIGNSISSLNNLNILNVNSFIVASSNITACSNMITSNINSISINNAGVLTTSTITQLNKNPITLRGLITSESNISFNQNNDILSLPVINASLMGGSGSRIIFKAAKNISSLPDAIGLNTDTLWISSSNLLFYINNENRVTINSNGVIITSNQINQLNPGVNNFFMGKVGIATSTESSYNLNGNYASNISNVLLTNYNSLNTITNTNISNYALNISNILTTRDATNLINTSNYASNISNVLLTNYNSLNTTTNTNISNYALNISNILTARDATNLSSSSNYASNISNIIIARYLPLTAGTLTGTLTAPTINLTTSADGMNPLFIRSAQPGANNCIYIQNNINQNAYIGLGGSTFEGNYRGNLFFESASGSIILNASGRTSTSIPNMIIHSTGNVGIGTNNPDSKLHIMTSDNTAITTNLLNFKNTSDYGIYATSASISTRGNTIDFYSRDFNNGLGISTRPIISLRPEGNVGIGTTNPTNILQVGDGGRLRISNSTSDYTLIGSKETDDSNNTRIVISGNNRTGYNGNIQYFATSTGRHVFSNDGTERMVIIANGNVGIGTNNPLLKLDVRGKVIINDNTNDFPKDGNYGGTGTKIVLWPVDGNEVPFSLGIGPATLWYACPSASKHDFYIGTVNVASFTRGGFEILTLKSPSNANYQLLFAPPSATSGAAIQTILQGSGYNQNLLLQQIDGNVGIGTNNPATNKLYVNGNTTINGNLTLGGTSGKIFLPNTLDKFKINLWGTNDYGFGIADGTLQYTSVNFHRFYSGTTNTFSIYSNGNIYCNGEITNGSSSYLYAGGLRIGGHDTANTIWQGSGNLGISANGVNNIIFSISNGGEKMRITSAGFVGINTNDPKCHLQVNGIANINNGSPSAVPNNYMQSGSLTIGGCS